jgi:protein phosphatase 1 regulatory subunit 7
LIFFRASITPVEDETEETLATPSSTKPKLKARLGETQIVELSDDEDDADLVGRDDDDTAGDASDPDFLKEYPDETDVSAILCCTRLQSCRNCLLILLKRFQDLHLQHLKIISEQLTQLHFPRFGKHLNRLCLRQNNLTSPLPSEAFEGLEALKELDFYDNRLGSRVHDDEIAGCPNITYVNRPPSSTPLMHILMLIRI